MRLLADNPSMEFLRQEAKDLLGSLRESDEKVTLADAQRATAELYGFRTWSELKADVERRRRPWDWPLAWPRPSVWGRSRRR